jgi:hypothetical protein
VQVRTKLAEKTRVSLWGQSIILKAVWDITEKKTTQLMVVVFFSMVAVKVFKT